MKINFTHLHFYPAPARLGIFILILLIIWLPIAAPIYLATRFDPNLGTILTMGILFIEFIFLVRFWGKKVHQSPQPLKSYGLEGTRRNGLDLLNGLSIGLLFTLSLFLVEGLLGWVKFQPPTVGIIRIILEGLISALGVGFAEELVFRGWLLDELQRDYSLKLSLWLDAVIFGLLHFIKPISEVIRTFPSFPALVLLGLSLVWAKRGRNGRLGISIGLHAGLVWGYYIINIGQLVSYSDNISPWITGVDGNPLASVMGLLFLGVLAFLMKRRVRKL